MHPLIRDAQKRLGQSNAVGDHKGLLSAPSEVLHIVASPAALERCLSLMNSLVIAVAEHGVDVRIDAARKLTIFDFAGTPVPVCISEHAKQIRHVMTAEERKALDNFHRNPRLPLPKQPPVHDYQLTGILTITGGQYFNVSNWRDTRNMQLEERIPEVVTGLFKLSERIRLYEEKQVRDARETRLIKELYQSSMQRRKDEKERFEKLESDALNWERARRIRAYVNSVERRNAEFATDKDVQWLAWARAKADWVDPDVYVSDPILDGPEPKKPGYCWEE